MFAYCNHLLVWSEVNVAPLMEAIYLLAIFVSMLCEFCAKHFIAIYKPINYATTVFEFYRFIINV